MVVDLIVQPKQVFGNTVADHGEGWMIAMKLALQAFADKRFLLVFSPGAMSKNAPYLKLSSIVSENPLAAARGLAKATGQLVLVFAGDIATKKYIASFKNVQENIVYVCCNNAGSSSSSSRSDVEKQLVHLVSARYAATASPSFPEDYMRKLLKAKSVSGFVFLEVHCPSPKLWGFDSSNTIEVSRMAVNTNLWPLLEFIGTNTTLNYKPEHQEPLEMYLKIQSRFAVNNVEKIRNQVTENMKFIAKCE